MNKTQGSCDRCERIDALITGGLVHICKDCLLDLLDELNNRGAVGLPRRSKGERWAYWRGTLFAVDQIKESMVGGDPLEDRLKILEKSVEMAKLCEKEGMYE